MRLNSSIVDAVAKQKELSNRRLAIKAGVNPRFLGRLRKGERTASRETIQRIADELGVEVDLILLPHSPVKERRP
jgi:transcriptional regulator with XRE-family HTH domain